MINRVFKYAAKNIARNKFLSISSVLVLTLLMFFINILLVLHNVSFKLIDSINSKMTISLYLSEEYDKNSSAVIDLLNDIDALSQDLEVEYRNKNQVLEDLKEQDFELVKILERSNPLPETITVSNIPLYLYEDLNYIIEWKIFLFDDGEDQNASNDMSSYTSQYERIQKVTTVLETLMLWLYVIIWVFLVSIAIIIYSIISNFIYYYRWEIYITRLVWWSKFYIHGPFGVQWMIYSVISFFISVWLFMLLLKNISFVFGEQYSLEFVFKNIELVLALELALFIFIWLISWYLSSRKYLK